MRQPYSVFEKKQRSAFRVQKNAEIVESNGRNLPIGLTGENLRIGGNPIGGGVMEYIARIRNDFKDKFGIPRQSGRVKNISKIVFEPKYRDPQSLRGIEAFSHLWILFDFSLARREDGGWSPTVRPPRLGGNERMGVFATRSPFRPNGIGLSSVRLVGVSHSAADGTFLTVEGADLLDGTPIYDIKPYLPYCDCHVDAAGGFADSFVDHRLVVNDPDGLLRALPEADAAVVRDCIAEDPRPAYKTDGEEYAMRYGDFDVTFYASGTEATITRVKKIQNGR